MSIFKATVQYSGQPTGPGGSRLVGFPGTAPSTVTSQVHGLPSIVLVKKYILNVSGSSAHLPCVWEHPPASAGGAQEARSHCYNWVELEDHPPA